MKQETYVLQAEKTGKINSPRVAYETHKLKKTDTADKQWPLAELQQCHKKAGSDLDANPPTSLWQKHGVEQ